MTERKKCIPCVTGLRSKDVSIEARACLLAVVATYIVHAEELVAALLTLLSSSGGNSLFEI